jgi:DNA mismatch endonuclease (patch repair protein)
MVDIMSKEKRSLLMSRIKAEGTTPELAVRRYLHGQGLRFRLHSNKLPGRPDLILPKYKTVVFVHGCFWHQHEGCPHGHLPKSNQGYWNEKLRKNVERDKANTHLLVSLGWSVEVVWECEISEERLDCLVATIRRRFTS